MVKLTWKPHGSVILKRPKPLLGNVESTLIYVGTVLADDQIFENTISVQLRSGIFTIYLTDMLLDRTGNEFFLKRKHAD